ncbi:PLP-dependent aminotransferase family protein [Galbitalea soli]|uniref:PLP-dependent aminotransferase family protein n=1 Tax=Galbitalea soli TaxID=1268042 RepID=A0A7C9PP71_9MICO|nr:PLP-dependent aminotransferase family protein [Galbitalea soli]NEM91929.1 PLP-dependent aminotransferase family protein [Galbitalea soli]NYJ29232.1 DNA-binding transcriptional MocR family regulator [Galbitalea soli]
MALISARALGLLLEGWRSDPAHAAYVALADRVRLLILDGRIPLSTRIPAERDLAAQLGISRTTVTAAYAELRDAGYLRSLRGSGSVAQLPSTASRPADAFERGYLDFSKAALPALPVVADAATRAAQELPAHLGETGFDPIGVFALREAIADRYTARGLPTSADDIMVTVGAQHAIALLSRTLLSRGDRALVETPSYPHAMEALWDAGARLVPVSVSTEDGWDEAQLEQAIQRTSPSLGYLMPDFHNPTGASMSDELKEKTARLATAAGTILIADETMGELAIDGPGARTPFAAYGGGSSRHVVIGSVGKSIWGGLRVGWIRAEPSIMQRLIRSRNSGDLGTPILEQLIVKNLLADYDQILETRRGQLRLGRDHLAAALAARMPEWSIPTPAGGLTFWVGLGDAVSSQFTLAARNHGLLLAAGPRFGIDGAFERFLRLPYSYSLEELDRGADALAAAWADVGRYSLPETGYLAAVV